MLNFFYEELVLILVSLFIFALTAFVVTRPFVNLPAKKILPAVALFLIVALVAHYNWRMAHIAKVKKAFNEGKNILCIDKTNKIGYVLIQKGEWKIVHDEFRHPEFPRGYNVRQCVVE